MRLPWPELQFPIRNAEVQMGRWKGPILSDSPMPSGRRSNGPPPKFRKAPACSVTLGTESKCCSGRAQMSGVTCAFGPAYSGSVAQRRLVVFLAGRLATSNPA